MSNPGGRAQETVSGGSGHELRLDEKDFRRIAKHVRDFAGITLADGKMPLVRARLAKRLRALGLRKFRDYCALIEAGDDAALHERQELITAITTNVTRFFREPHHFDSLRTRALPPLIERAKRGGRVRLWSAGCSTGEEPYSIALTVLELMPDVARYDVKILASDLDRSVLARAERGVYPERALEAVPNELKARYFDRMPTDDEPDYALRAPVRALLSFRSVNLTTSWPMKGGFDVIFCRNVVIYFDAATEMALWRAFAARLPTGGWLFIGHSERVNTLALPVFASDGVTTYRKL